MAKLFLKTENGVLPIEQSQIKKYNLEVGEISPYTNYCIVDENGNDKKRKKTKNKSHHSIDEIMDEGIVFSTSEILDIAQGADAVIEDT
ncbi:MAG: hypothetical protein BWY15_01326 [Firmicutes bacterium ADurb.Bin193]|nr:MAG: hypothetical protein BWY15_01326 [Firmicutes bacterium ADurb.Bin193]